MDEYETDKFGIPVIDREQIEEKAEEFLRYYDESLLVEPKATPVVDICERTLRDFRVPFVLDQDLGKGERGRKILGRFQRDPRVIFVDPSLVPTSPRWRFTICHELGHLVFHRKVNLRAAKASDADTESDLQEARAQPRSNREWMEWHANAFASSVLLPRRTVARVVALTVQELQFTNFSFGIIYLDNQPCNVTNYLAIQHKLCEVFKASKASVEIRLKRLNLLVDERRQRKEHISALLRED